MDKKKPRITFVGAGVNFSIMTIYAVHSSDVRCTCQLLFIFFLLYLLERPQSAAIRYYVFALRTNDCNPAHRW